MESRIMDRNFVIWVEFVRVFIVVLGKVRVSLELKYYLENLFIKEGRNFLVIVVRKW